MTRFEKMALTVGLGMMLAATLPAMGQAYTVASSGGLVQEKPDSVMAIPPEDRASKEQLGRLFDAMRIKDQVQKIRALVPQMVQAQIREQAEALGYRSDSKLTPAQHAALERLSQKYVEKAMNVYPAEEMIADITPVYQHYLTREDVDAMIVFYTSPAGQHLLNAQPKIVQEYMPMVMQRVQERTRVLIAEMMKEAADITQGSQPAKQ